MTPAAIQYIIDNFISNNLHIALYIEYIDITNHVETLLIYKKDIVFIEVIETVGNEKEDYINNYLLKVELQSDSVIYIQPASLSNIQPLTKEQYNRAVELIKKKHSTNNEDDVDSEEDNSIELDIDLSEDDVDSEDIQYNPDEAITYITTDIAKLAAYLSTPQVDKQVINNYNNKMYSILKKLSKLFKNIKYNNTLNNLQKNNISLQDIKNNLQKNNKLSNKKQQVEQEQNIKQIEKYIKLYNKINLSNKTITNQIVDSIIKDIKNIVDNISKSNKKDIQNNLSNIINKYNNLSNNNK